MSQQLIARHEAPAAPLAIAELTRDQIELLKRTVARGCTDDEFQLFLHVCKTRRLDPFSKLIYPVKRYDSKLRAEVMALQSSIDSFRLVAERNGKYAGQLGPEWCGPDGQWRDVWLENGPPAAARVAALRHDFKEPLWTVALWSNYCQVGKDGGPTRFWANMGPLMLAKCAEALALRRAFPEDLAGLYTSDEMAQAGPELEPRDAQPEPAQAAPAQPQAHALPPAKPKTIEGLLASQAKPQAAPAPQAAPPAAEPARPDEPRKLTTRWEARPGGFMETKILVSCGFWNLWADKEVPGSMLQAKGYKTWRVVSDGSRDGIRHKLLKECVEWAKKNVKDATDFHERCACTLAVMEWKHSHQPQAHVATAPEPDGREPEPALAPGELFGGVQN